MLTNIFYDGKTTHVWNRDKNGILHHKIDNKFKSYFYYSNKKLPMIKKDDAIKVTVNNPFEINTEKNKYDNTYEADILYDIRYVIDNYKIIPKHKLRVCNVDIETYSKDKTFPDIDKANKPIVLISFYDNFKNKLYTFGFKLGINKIDNDNKIFIFDNEKEMLINFIKAFRQFQPDAITGWNVNGFDIPYIVNRLKLYKIEKFLSPINKIKFNKYDNTYEIAGISSLDYLPLYKHHSINKRESYSLNYISEFELGDTKLKFDGDINELYEKDFDKYIEYNRKDVMLVNRLEQKLKYIELTDEIRRLAHIPFKYYSKVTKVMDSLLINILNEKDYIVKTANKNNMVRDYTGAFVQEPLVGLYDWVIDNDYTSLYPFIIKNLNISPETKNNCDKPVLFLSLPSLSSTVMLI